MPAEVNEIMQELMRKQFSRSEQHKNTSNARRTRYNKAVDDIFNFLQYHNLFEAKGELHNIATCVTVVELTNPHKPVEVWGVNWTEWKDRMHFSLLFEKSGNTKTKCSYEIMKLHQWIFQKLLIKTNSWCSQDSSMNCRLIRLLNKNNFF